MSLTSPALAGGFFTVLAIREAQIRMIHQGLPGLPCMDTQNMHCVHAGLLWIFFFFFLVNNMHM